MNSKQRVIILAGIALIALMLLVPPWKYYRSGRGEGGGFAGYGLIFYPNVRQTISLDPFYFDVARSSDVYLDTSVLAVQCLLVAVVAGGFTFLFQTRKN